MTTPLFVEAVRRLAAERPGALAVRAPDGERTYGELAARAEAIAARLRGEGCLPGDRIAVIGKPSLAWLDAMAGAMFARAAFAPMSTALAPAELAGLLADAEPRIVFADPGIADGVCPPDKAVRLDDLDDWLQAGPGTGAPAIPEPADLFSIIYSSGTTGVPKGIAHTAGARADFIAARPRPDLAQDGLAYLATALATNLSFSAILAPLYWGGAVSLASRFAEAEFLRACEEERVTDVSLVPVQVRRILDDPGFSPARLASLRVTLITGSPLDIATKQRLAEAWPGFVLDAYGTTETGGIATLDIKGNPDRLDSVGKVLGGVDCVILGDDGRPLPPGETGEIAAASDVAMEGYYNRDDLTGAATGPERGGRRYIRTGDVGRLDADGFLFVTGRSKDMIISGGTNVFAVDIEAALAAHPDVAEAAAIAVPDDRWGETPHAFIVPAPGASPTAGDLIAWLEPRLSRISRPSGYSFVASLPRNEMGKVLKRELRAPFWAGRGGDIA